MFRARRVNWPSVSAARLARRANKAQRARVVAKVTRTLDFVLIHVRLYGSNIFGMNIRRLDRSSHTIIENCHHLESPRLKSMTSPITSSCSGAEPSVYFASHKFRSRAVSRRNESFDYLSLHRCIQQGTDRSMYLTGRSTDRSTYREES